MILYNISHSPAARAAPAPAAPSPRATAQRPPTIPPEHSEDPMSSRHPHIHSRALPTCPCGDSSCPKRRLIEREINRHGAQVRYIALMITRDMPLAEDLTQNLMVKLLANPHCYQDEGVFLAFAKRVISNTHLNWIRDNKRLSSYDEMVSAERDPDVHRVSIEDLMDLSEEDEGFEALLSADLMQKMGATLHSKPLDHDIFNRLCEGLGGAEISAMTGMNSNTVHGVIRRVRQALFQAFPLELEGVVGALRKQRADGTGAA